MANRKLFTGNLKARAALAALRADRILQEVAAQHGVHSNEVSRWRSQAQKGPGMTATEARVAAAASRACTRPGYDSPELSQECP